MWRTENSAWLWVGSMLHFMQSRSLKKVDLSSLARISLAS
jgi:hypothetical protein